MLLTVSRIRLSADPSRYFWQQFNHRLLKTCEDEIVKRELSCKGRFDVDFQSRRRLCSGQLYIFFGLIFLTSGRRYSRRDGAIFSAKQVLEFGWSGLLSSGW
jgi:hypothetical protein